MKMTFINPINANTVKSMVAKITENTLIPISLVITLVGFVFWLTNIYAQTASNSETIKKIETKQDKYIEDISQIRSDIEIIRNNLTYLKGNK